MEIAKTIDNNEYSIIQILLTDEEIQECRNQSGFNDLVLLDDNKVLVNKKLFIKLNFGNGFSIWLMNLSHPYDTMIDIDVDLKLSLFCYENSLGYCKGEVVKDLVNQIWG